MRRGGYLGDLVPSLSTKAAIYSGIISTEMPRLPVYCETGNCSWPVFPTLAACGECITVNNVSSTCNETSRMCTYSVDSGNTLDVPMDPAAEFNIFKVAPSNGSAHPIKSTNRAYFSVFDMLSLVQSEDQGLSVTGSECALWFCVQSFKLLVFDGTHNESKVGNWSTTELARGGNLHGSGYSFIGLPENMNADNTTTYSVSKEAIIALRTFMAGITTGVVRADTNMLDYSSDWVEAMWNATNNLEAWMGSFTEAMTAEFRINGRLSNGLGGTKVYAGSATQLAPFIRVQWWWMFYPGCMLLISFYYFFRTAVISARHGVSAWKGDALPMLFVRVDDNIHAHVGDGMDVPGGLTDRVGNIRIAMYRDEDGQWRFRSTRDDPKEV